MSPNPESPYPGPKPKIPASGDEVVIQFTVKELLEQIKNKLDKMVENYDSRISALEHHPPIVNGEFRMAHVETEVAAHTVLLAAMDKADALQAGGVLFKDKVMHKLIGLASVMGVVAGITFQILQSL